MKKVGLGPGHIVLDRDPAPLPKKGAEPPPQFSAYFCCGQTVGCIKLPHGMEVGLSPGDFVLDGDPTPLSKKGGGAPNFRPMSIMAKRLDGPRCHLVPRPLRGTAASNFRPISVVAKKAQLPTQFLVHVYCGQTAGWMKTPLLRK